MMPISAFFVRFGWRLGQKTFLQHGLEKSVFEGFR